MSISPCPGIHPSPVLAISRCQLNHENTRCPGAAVSQGLLEFKQTFSPAIIATPVDFTLESSSLRYYRDASTQYSPVASTKTVSPGALIAVPVVERGAPGAKCHSIQEAMQSPGVPAYKISSPRSAPQFPTAKQSPSRGRVQLDSLFAHTNLSSPRSITLAPTRAKILPARYEFCKVEDLVVLISAMISDLIQINDQLPLREGGVTRFHSK